MLFCLKHLARPNLIVSVVKDALKDKDKLAKEYPCIYERCQIEHEMEITVPGLILVALMSGGE